MSMVLNLGVAIPWEGVEHDPRDHRETQMFTLQFITVAKLQLGSSNEVILRLGVTTT